MKKGGERAFRVGDDLQAGSAVAVAVGIRTIGLTHDRLPPFKKTSRPGIASW
jgi:hypothetical protein